jgi:hypothetical protein
MFILRRENPTNQAAEMYLIYRLVTRAFLEVPIALIQKLTDIQIVKQVSKATETARMIATRENIWIFLIPHDSTTLLQAGMLVSNLV